MLKDLYKLAERDGVIVERWPLTPPLDALYIKEPGIPPLIAISTRIAEGTAAYNTLLAHELGHHFTTAGEVVSCRQYAYGDILDLNRAEYRANRWAAECLLPWEEFCAAIRAGTVERWELAEHFGVTEELVEFRLGALQACADADGSLRLAARRLRRRRDDAATVPEEGRPDREWDAADGKTGR